MSWKYRKKLNDFMTAVADDSEGEIWIYGDIVDNAWWDDEVSPKTVRDALQDMGSVGTVNIRVNSFGGSVVAGNAIINILDTYRRKTGCKINAYIEGIAASMGSGIPMVADKIYMAENAMYMIHKPWSIAAGNSADLEKTVEELEKAEDTLVVNYMRKFNGTEAELRQMLADETWLTADEALEWGLCDEIIPAVPVAASANGIRINNREFVTNAGKIAARFIHGTPLARSPYSVVPETTINPPLPKSKKEGEPKMYEYDQALYDKYGITGDFFDELNAPANVIDRVMSKIVNANLTVRSEYHAKEHEVVYTAHLFSKPDPNDMFKSTQLACWIPENFVVDKNIVTNENPIVITQEMAHDCIPGIADDYLFDEETILNMARASIAVDASALEKSKAYDKMVKNAIDVAIQNGIRAKGEKFNEIKWKKTLESWDYDEIIEQSAEWSDEAKTALKAGKRVSQPWNPTSKDNGNVNPDNYNFCK